MKEARCKSPHTEWFHFYKISRKGNFVVDGKCINGCLGEWIGMGAVANGYIGGDENDLKLSCIDDCTNLNLLKPLNWTLMADEFYGIACKWQFNKGVKKKIKSYC